MPCIWDPASGRLLDPENPSPLPRLPCLGLLVRAHHHQDGALEDRAMEIWDSRFEIRDSRSATSLTNLLVTGVRHNIYHIHRELAKVSQVKSKWVHHRRVHLGRCRWRCPLKIEGKFWISSFFLPLFLSSLAVARPAMTPCWYGYLARQTGCGSSRQLGPLTWRALGALLVACQPPTGP